MNQATTKSGAEAISNLVAISYQPSVISWPLTAFSFLPFNF